MISLDKRGYSMAARVGIGLLTLSLAVVLMMGRWQGALVLGAFLLASVVFMAQRHRLPSLFDLLFVVAAIVNAAGWVVPGLWIVPAYDEVVHAYTSFALTLALGFLTYSSMWMHFREHGTLFVVTVASLGLALGALWEVFEWALAMPHNNPGMDLLMDAIGALAAGVAVAWVLQHEPPQRVMGRSAASSPAAD